jgi:transposase
MSPRIYSEGQIELDYTKNGLGRILGRFAFWIATGHTDMRRGMQSLALAVQESLKRDPHAGDLYIFRGRRGDLVKILWHDGLGMSLYAKRLDRGKFIRPAASAGASAASSNLVAF